VDLKFIMISLDANGPVATIMLVRWQQISWVAALVFLQFLTCAAPCHSALQALTKFIKKHAVFKFELTKKKKSDDGEEKADEEEDKKDEL
jgi:hypothetical protein